MQSLLDQLPVVCNLMSDVTRALFNFLIPYVLWSPTYILPFKFCTHILFASFYENSHLLWIVITCCIHLWVYSFSYSAWSCDRHKFFIPCHHKKGFQHHNLHTEVHCQNLLQPAYKFTSLLNNNFWFSHSLTPLLVLIVYKQQKSKFYIFPYQRVFFSEFLPKLICSW